MAEWPHFSFGVPMGNMIRTDYDKDSQFRTFMMTYRELNVNNKFIESYLVQSNY